MHFIYSVERPQCSPTLAQTQALSASVLQSDNDRRILDVARRCPRIERPVLIKALAASLAYLLVAYVFAPALLLRLHLGMPEMAYLGGEALIGRWTTAMIDSDRRDVRNRRTRFTYPAASIYAALDAYANSTIKSKRGLVIGSQSPWLESFLLEYGASHVTTLDFGTIMSEHPQISRFTPRDFTTNFLHGDIEPYDSAFTYSSIVHDGLGRYGDVPNPDGDLEMMARMLSVVKPGGFVYVGVPCCHDVVEWNAHRIYGPKRLPELFAGWKIVSVFPENEISAKRALTDWTFQPVWLLQNALGCSEDLTRIAGLFRKVR